MKWTITVRPTTEQMVEFAWTAERFDRETIRMGTAATHAVALAEAKAVAAEHERIQQVMDEATTVEEFTPTDEEIAAVVV